VHSKKLGGVNMNIPSYYGASYIGAAALVGCIVGINIAALDNGIAAKTKAAR
jgi:hypothetical protein